jgi:hypothetical protein
MCPHTFINYLSLKVCLVTFQIFPNLLKKASVAPEELAVAT